MIRHHCDYCGVYFGEPSVSQYSEFVGGYLRKYAEERCPICGCDSFSGADNCSCSRPKLTGERLCESCKAALKARVVSFFDTLTAEEEEQFDDWMDGDSIANRKEWKT